MLCFVGRWNTLGCAPTSPRYASNLGSFYFLRLVNLPPGCVVRGSPGGLAMIFGMQLHGDFLCIIHVGQVKLIVWDLRFRWFKDTFVLWKCPKHVSMLHLILVQVNCVYIYL